MRYFALLAVIFCSLLLPAQGNVLIKGYVLDYDTKEPLSLAAIQIKNTQLGALSEDNGYFELPIPRNNLGDSLLVSYIGYLSTGLSVQNYNPADTLRVLLSTSAITTTEAVITAMNARGALLRAIDSMKTNLFLDSLIGHAFYRQYHKENGKYVRLIEADVSVAFNCKNVYRYSFHESVKVNKQRRSENYETNGDVHGDHLVDLLKENPYSYNRNNFLDKKKIDFYAPKFADENQNEYVVSVQYKENSSQKLEQAKLWIDKTTFAITRIEIEKYPNPYYQRTRYENESRWKLVNEKNIIETDVVNGKYVVSGITRAYNHHVLNRITGQVDFVVEESFEMYFYDYTTQKVGEELAKGYSAFTDLYIAKYRYDNAFWNDYNPLEEYPTPDAVVKDLEHTRKLGVQFVEAGK